MNDDAFFEYVGNLHIHSSISDGAGTVSEIIQAASKVGLDFVILNDHDFLADSLHLDAEGFHNGVLTLVGLEIGKRFHHYLAYDLKQMVKAGNSSPQEVIDRVNDQSGFGFLAHPFEKGMPFHDKSAAYTWNDLTVKGFTGIEIWNFSSRWKERVRTVFHGLFFLLCKSWFLKGPSRETLSFWDNLCQQRKVVAIGGSDSHGTFFKWGMIRIRPLTYDFLLSTINIHILLERELPKEFSEAKAEIYAAVREGQLFIAHERLASAAGFRFHYVSDNGNNLTMGGEGEFESGDINVNVPKHGEIRLIKDGALKERWYGRKASFRVEQSGVYRVEVYLYLFPFGWRPWIFSNPIYLR